MNAFQRTMRRLFKRTPPTFYVFVTEDPNVLGYTMGQRDNVDALIPSPAEWAAFEKEINHAHSD